MTKKDETEKVAKAEAFRAIHVYLSRTAWCCADKWGDTEMAIARRMLREMSIPWTGTKDELRAKFQRLRKNGKLPSVISRGMRRTHQKP